jgi:methyl-accepting chemotaxis protein
VRENTASLILKELEYTKQIQVEIARTQFLSELAGGLLLLVIGIGCVVYSLSFSKKLIVPLTDLTGIAKQIAGGNIDITVDKKLLASKDELGSMATSFNTMILTLRENIRKLPESNTQLVEAKKKVDFNNSKLERMNSLMIGRELRMTEMKKELEELNKRVQS